MFRRGDACCEIQQNWILNAANQSRIIPLSHTSAHRTVSAAGTAMYRTAQYTQHYICVTVQHYRGVVLSFSTAILKFATSRELVCFVAFYFVFLRGVFSRQGAFIESYNTSNEYGDRELLLPRGKGRKPTLALGCSHLGNLVSAI